MPRNCAFLTLEDRTGFCIYDHLLFAPLADRGWKAVEIPWNRPDVDWAAFDAVVIRSTWDYQKTPEKFLSTLEAIEGVTKLYNPVAICRWNLNKRYLRDLQEKGVAIVPTTWLERLDEATLPSLFSTLDAPRLVAKPLVGANADDAFVLQARDAGSWTEALRVFGERQVMVQPFVEAIPTEGEYSLFYFGGRLSHAIVKRPAAGDFRVQEEHGGIITPATPTEDLVAAGSQAIQAIGTTLLYARVDLVRLASGQAALMEMELIEPSLYFDQHPDSAAIFAGEFVRMAGA